MKNIITIALILILVCFVLTFGIRDACSETNITFIWNMTDVPDLAGFNLYQREGVNEYDYTKPIATIEDPNVREYTLNGVEDNKNLYWVLRAVDFYGLESKNSNEINEPSTGCPSAPELSIKVIVDVNINH